MASSKICIRDTKARTRRAHELEEMDEEENIGTAYLCSYCYKRFASSALLEQHIGTFHLKKCFVCSTCKKIFSQRGSLNKHELTVHKNLKCSGCGVVFKARGYLDNHANRCPGADKQCDICGRCFKTVSLMNQHVRRHHEHSRHICSFCNLIVKDKTNLKLHNLKRHGIPVQKPEKILHDFNEIARLEESQPFKHLSDMQQHITKVQGQGVTSENAFKCPQCGKSFSYKRNLTKHIQQVHTEKSVPCPQCKQMFKNETALQKHFSKRHAVTHVCPECNKVLSSSKNLERHMTRNHSNEVKCKQSNITMPTCTALQTQTDGSTILSDNSGKNVPPTYCGDTSQIRVVSITRVKQTGVDNIDIAEQHKDPYPKTVNVSPENTVKTNIHDTCTHPVISANKAIVSTKDLKTSANSVTERGLISTLTNDATLNELHVSSGNVQRPTTLPIKSASHSTALPSLSCPQGKPNNNYTQPSMTLPFNELQGDSSIHPLPVLADENFEMTITDSSLIVLDTTSKIHTRDIMDIELLTPIDFDLTGREFSLADVTPNNPSLVSPIPSIALPPSPGALQTPLCEVFSPVVPPRPLVSPGGDSLLEQPLFRSERSIVHFHGVSEDPGT